MLRAARSTSKLRRVRRPVKIEVQSLRSLERGDRAVDQGSDLGDDVSFSLFDIVHRPPLFTDLEVPGRSADAPSTTAPRYLLFQTLLL